MGRAAMVVVARAAAVLGMGAVLAAGCSEVEVAPEAGLWARPEGSWVLVAAVRAAGVRGATATVAVEAATVAAVVTVAATVRVGAKVAERRRFRASSIRP